ncbi:DUF6310 domain-containing protein [Archangium primigenium]|uniref:DUF6310 domain-containing protein n=1 Tax=[Archangium] primigenium TaxID=2792470 RepID=UPI001EF96650|nr:DUF6310 domain-containing protein [Archangium primigenium]
MGIGMCILAAPEVIVGTVVVIGVVTLAVAIEQELGEYALKGVWPEDGSSSTQSGAQSADKHPLADKKAKPQTSSSGQDWLPPHPPDAPVGEHQPDCRPVKVAHRGGHPLHNQCADNVPHNGFSGGDVRVNGKNFDALQVASRTLWEVKTTNIEAYNPYVQRAELEKQVEEAQRERDLAAACGYDFVMGVRTQAHKALLEREDFTLRVVVMDWC